jgi:lipopolysaccharide export system protein LptA
MSKLFSNRQLIFCLALLPGFFGFFAVGAAMALENRGASGKGGPITVTANSLQADSKARTALFEGSVVAKSDDMVLYADRMTVRYAEGGGVERIEAEGAVKVVRDQRVITSGRAEYIRAEGKIIFSDSPRVAEGGSVITGSSIVYFVDEDRTAVKDSKVFMEGR